MSYLVSGVGKPDKEIKIRYGKEERVIMPGKNGFWQIDLATFSDYGKYKTVLVGKRRISIVERPYGIVVK